MTTGAEVKGALERIITGVPEGLDALVLAQLVAEARAGNKLAPKGEHKPEHKAEHAHGTLLHVARDDRRLDALEHALAFFAPDVRVLSFPAWDTVPYDRIGPNAEIVAKRIATLAKLSLATRKHPTVVLTTVNAVLQRVPSRSFLKRAVKHIAPGQRIDMSRLTQRLSLTGFTRSGTVMEPGEYAVRGGILDFFPPGRVNPRAPRLLRRHAGNHQGVRGADPAHNEERAEAGTHARQRGRVRRGGREVVPRPLRGAVRRIDGRRPVV